MTGLTVYYDFRSPTSYLGARVLELNGINDVDWVPISLLYLADYGNRMMGFNDQRRAVYTQRDLARSAKRLELPFAIPEFVTKGTKRSEDGLLGKDHPIDSHLALRGACVAERRGKITAYNSAVFDALWGQGRDIGQPEQIGGVAKAIGEEPEKFLKEAMEEPAEAQMLANTKIADELGVFEVPAMFVGESMICGYDRIDTIKYELEKLVA